MQPNTNPDQPVIRLQKFHKKRFQINLKGKAIVVQEDLVELVKNEEEAVDKDEAYMEFVACPVVSKSKDNMVVTTNKLTEEIMAYFLKVNGLDPSKAPLSLLEFRAMSRLIAQKV
ncbi:hypothetical protein ACH5RR_008866 [Cinchona calisaya]|uniref:SKP1 component POZ domain-containing protein n=1 Tax=Cinchona calisaya TaxID=153742 RepID=A0ABD3ACT2_9GENT